MVRTLAKPLVAVALSLIPQNKLKPLKNLVIAKPKRAAIAKTANARFAVLVNARYVRWVSAFVAKNPWIRLKNDFRAYTQLLRAKPKNVSIMARFFMPNITLLEGFLWY